MRSADSEVDETVPAAVDSRSSSATLCARLVLVHPRSHAHALDTTPALLGRHTSPEVQIAADHRTVSRRHAVIRWDAAAGHHSIADLGSRNGTWLNGQPVSALPRYLDDQSVVRIGSVLAVYERRELAPDDDPQVSRDILPGDSFAIRQLRAQIGRAGPDPSPALILGETGAGKEGVAAELHRLAGRRGPLLTINCAALSPQLIESQLFGHTRGAFTGATQEHTGMFRAASGGSLFLDELGELPLELQPKLLRAVELGEVVAVGSTTTHRVDVRLIAATNRSLLTEIDHGRFRRDLYARLALWELPVPPLRARRVDLLPWIDRLHAAWCAQHKRSELSLDLLPEAAEAILLHSWPDNLRGLQRFVHARGGAAQTAPLSRADLGPWLADLSREPGREPTPAAPSASAPPARSVRPRPTRDDLLATLTAHGWSIRATAKHYQRDRKQISRWIEMYGLGAPGRATD